jgi:branched-chain amino acid transport system substrate-binding protein
MQYGEAHAHRIGVALPGTTTITVEGNEMNLFQKTASTILATSLIASAAQAQLSDDEIRIGYLADMSGTYRDLSGPGGLEALKMAVEDFGGQIDGKKIVIFSADDLNKPDVGASTVRQWVDERNVDMVTGLVASSVVLAASQVVEQAGKLALISGAAASSITNEYCSPNHIHWTYDSYALANGTAKAVLAPTSGLFRSSALKMTIFLPSTWPPKSSTAIFSASRPPGPERSR